MPRIKVILGSTRHGRFGSKPAEWIMELAKEHPEATFELVDLAEQNLPFFADTKPPSTVTDGQYDNEAARAWSKIINEADGFVVVTAEYNFGVPAPLKNAIDTLAHEWAYKPVAFVSYGAAAGGARAVEDLRSSAGWLRMYDLREQVIVPNYWAQLDEAGAFLPTKQQGDAAHALLRAVAFWADQLKPIREEIQKTA